MMVNSKYVLDCGPYSTLIKIPGRGGEVLKMNANSGVGLRDLHVKILRSAQMLKFETTKIEDCVANSMPV